MKKKYYIPTIEVLTLLTEDRIMGMAGQSDSDHLYGAPKRRASGEPGDMKSY